MDKFNFPNHLINNASVITITSFLIVAFLAITFFWPGFQELSSLGKNIEQKKTELQGKQEYIARLNQIKAQLEERSHDFSKIKSALPEDPSLPSVFNYLQQASSESGLVLERISPFSISPASDAPGLREAAFSINLAGSYSSFKNFLLVLEKSARLIEVENISFSAPEEGEAFNFTLRIKVFSY